MNKRNANVVRFERKDVPPLLPLWLAAGLAGFVAIVLVGIALFYPLANRQQDRGPLQHLPPAPLLQSAPHGELSQYEVAKERELKTSPTPIDVAMRRTAEQGWGSPK